MQLPCCPWFPRSPAPPSPPSPTGCRGVEIRGDGSGPHPALRLHGRLPGGHAGRLCRKAHRAQHGVKSSGGSGSPPRITAEVEVKVEVKVARRALSAMRLFSPPFSAHKPAVHSVAVGGFSRFLRRVLAGRT